MKMNNGLVTLALIAAAHAGPAFSQTYTVTDLGTFGGKSSAAYAINSRGQVVGTAETNHKIWSSYRDPFTHKILKIVVTIRDAFLWTPNQLNGTGGAIVDLNPNGPVDYNTCAYALNTRGDVVGSAGDSGDNSGASGSGVLWRDGAQIDLAGHSGVNGINDAGEIVGSGFLYAGGVFYGLPGSPGCGFAINSSGEIAGFVHPGQPCLWRPSVPNGSSLIATLLTDVSFACALNKATPTHPIQVVGDFGLWDSANGITSLGGIGYGINSSSVVVGSAGDVGFRWSRGYAFVWDSFHGARDLNTLIPAKSGWTLQAAYGINDLGQIVGVGKNSQGYVHGFLLTP